MIAIGACYTYLAEKTEVKTRTAGLRGEGQIAACQDGTRAPA